MSRNLQQFLPLGIVMLLRNMDLTEYTLGLQILYGVTQALSILVWLFVLFKVQSLPSGGKKLTIPEQKQLGTVVKPASECTVKEHDMDKWKEEFQKLSLGLVIVVAIHFYWEAIVPLAIQSLMAPVGVATNKLFQCHVLGQEVERPFPISLPFGSEGSPQAEEDKENKEIEEKKGDDKNAGEEKTKNEKKED